MNQLVEMHQPNQKLRCCPKASAPNKSGAPKKIKRVKGPIEKRNKKKARIGLVIVDEESLGLWSPDEGDNDVGGNDGDEGAV